MSKGITVNIKTNAAEARYFWERAYRDQLPFALSRAVNALAFDIRDREIARTHLYFDVRTRRMQSKFAMPVQMSHKKQYPNVFSVVSVRDEVAALNVTGGVRRPTGADDMAVPLSDTGDGTSAREILNPGRETLPKSKWPSNIVKANKATRRRRSGRKLKPKPFYLKTKTGRRFVALRTGVSHLPLKFVYEFKKTVIVNKTWPLVENAQLFVGANYTPYLDRFIRHAVDDYKR